MSALDPYAPPAATAPEDRTDPRFQVIQVMSRGWIAFAMACPVAVFAFLLRAYLTDSRLVSMLWPLSLTQIGVPLNLWFRNFRSARRVRSHPLVLSGQALSGGEVLWGTGRGAFAGFLYVTRDSLVFFRRSGGWDAGELTRLPLADLRQIAVRRRFGLFRVYLDLHRVSGSVTTYTVSQPRLWKNAINQVRREISAAVPPP